MWRLKEERELVVYLFILEVINTNIRKQHLWGEKGKKRNAL